MSIKLDKYMPLYTYLSPASIPQIVAHIQDYLVKHPILSVETIAEIIVQSLQEHPELINGEAIPISAESEQSIKAYIDALPALDTYTKAEINALLLGKQDTLTFDQAPTPGSSNPVTSSGIIAAMSALQSALETQISAKADRASTYTKTQVDTLLEDKADADDVYTKNTMDAKLLVVNTDIDNLETAVINQSQQIDNFRNTLAYVESGTTATRNYTIGQFIYIAESLYVTKTAIQTNEILVNGTNVELVGSGGLNRIQSVSLINGDMADYCNSVSSGTFSLHRVDRICVLSFSNVVFSINNPSYIFDKVALPYKPIFETDNVMIDQDSQTVNRIWTRAPGNIGIIGSVSSTGRYSGQIIYFTND